MKFNDKDIDNIKIPENLDERLKDTIDKNYKLKNDQKKVSFKRNKIAMIAGMALIISVGAFMSSSEYVEAAIMKIKESFKTRNYSITTDEGKTYAKTYELEHSDVLFKFNVDTSEIGTIKVIAADWNLEKSKYSIDFTINGESFSYYGELKNDNSFEYEIIIPEEVIGEKYLNLEITIIDLEGNEKKMNIDLKADSKESAIRYIPINQTYKIDGVRENTLQELIIYPDGRVELLYTDRDKEELDFKIRGYRIENEDGSKITETGEVGRNADDANGDLENIIWSEVAWRRKYKGKVTGDKLKITPDISLTNQGIKNGAIDDKEKIEEENSIVVGLIEFS